MTLQSYIGYRRANDALLLFGATLYLRKGLSKNIQTSVLFEQISAAIRVRDTGWLHEASHLLALDAAGETAVVVTSNHST